MEGKVQSILDMRVDQWTRVAIATVCGAGSILLLVRWLHHVQVRNKIQKARRRRESSLLQAERRVREYNDSVRSSLGGQVGLTTGAPSGGGHAKSLKFKVCFYLHFFSSK